ncbi:hypothetical protein QTL86_03390 [Cellulosilyticum sp. ST5]|uniref:hypothetical protein n=1 Tax=Cellulosilyticum sp. ST5 TaxID=3055805 RepID=UPI0039776548
MKMPKNKAEFEWLMLWAFSCGMTRGYGVEHTRRTEEEEEAIKEFAEEKGFTRKSLKVD